MNETKKVLEEYGVCIFRNGDAYSIATGRLIKHTPDKHGYPRVYATLPCGKRRGAFIHRLLAIAFIDNPMNKPHVNHIDGNKKNFAIENLEWCTAKENTAHSMNMGLWKPTMGKEFYETRDKVILNLHINGVSKEVIEKSFGISRPTLNTVIRIKSEA